MPYLQGRGSSGQGALSEIFAGKIMVFLAGPGTAQPCVHVEASCRPPEFETLCFFRAL